MDTLGLVAEAVVRKYRLFFSVAVVGISVHALVTYLQSPFRKLPPGPRGLPLLGNLLQLTHSPWTAFTDLRKKYGDLIYLNVAGQHMVVVSSRRIAADLLDRRAGIYCDRPRNIVVTDIMTRGLFVVSAPYGDLWRRSHKATHEGTNKGVVHRYHPTQHVEAVLLASGLLAEPDNWDGHLRRTSASSIMTIVYGHPPIIAGNDQSVRDINDFVDYLTHALLPGSYLVEFFPWMMYLPRILAPWRRKTEEWHIKGGVMFDGFLRGVKEKMKQGEDHTSFTATLLQTTEKHGLSELENSWLAGAIYAANAETSPSVMAWWMLAMVIYPETQKRAQTELDAVVGRDRLPTFADFESLPYIRAMAREALRWRPVVPLGVPRRCTQDDWYEGYFIPAGTTVIANVWHLNRDTEVYGKDAKHFNPARHLDEKGQIVPGSTESKEEGHFTYGFGRRICAGRYIANDSLFINIAVVLWAINIERATKAQGEPLPIDVHGFVDGGVVVRPVPFEVKLTPRFGEVVTILELERESHGLPGFEE